MEKYLPLLKGFYEAVAEDASLSISGSCLYLCFLYLYLRKDGSDFLLVNRVEVERYTRFSRTTYYKSLKELQDRGYIQYTPSYNHFLGSMVRFYGFPETVMTIKVNKHEILLTTRQG